MLLSSRVSLASLAALPAFRRALARVLVLALVFAPVTPALAQPAEAKAQLALGDKAARARDWAAAAAAYSAARAADPSPEALEGLGNALHAQGRFGPAYEAYEELVRNHLTRLTRPKRAAVEARLRELGQKTASFSVRTEEGAEVSLDGKLLGKAPFAAPVRIDAGPHKLRIGKAGFVKYEITLDAPPNGNVVHEARLVAENVKARLRVKEAQGRTVRVFIDGIDVGVAPWEGEVEPGPHEIVARGDQLLSAPEKITLEPSSTRTLEVRVSSSAATLKITVVDAPMAQIFLDGKLVSEGAFNSEVPSGLHKLAVVRPGYERFEEEIVLGDREFLSRTVVLRLSEAVKSGVEEKVAQRLEGIYGGFGFMGLLLPGGNGSDIQEFCKNKPLALKTCSSTGTGVGGGLFGYVGYHWDPVGLELALGGSYDQTRNTLTWGGANLGVGGGLGPDPARTEEFLIGRAGGFVLVRTRLTVQSRAVRGSFALGVGVSHRVSFLSRDTATTDGKLRDAFVSDPASSTSPVLSLDASVAPRFTEGLALPIGLSMLVESPSAKLFGDQIPRSAPDPTRALAPGVGLSTPTYQLSTGPQIYLGAYIGLMFGP